NAASIAPRANDQRGPIATEERFRLLTLPAKVRRAIAAPPFNKRAVLMLSRPNLTACSQCHSCETIFFLLLRRATRNFQPSPAKAPPSLPLTAATRNKPERPH